MRQLSVIVVFTLMPNRQHIDRLRIDDLEQRDIAAILALRQGALELLLQLAQGHVGIDIAAGALRFGL